MHQLYSQLRIRETQSEYHLLNTVSIEEMSNNELDPEICKYVIESYYKIMEETDESCEEVIDKYIHIKNEY